MPEAFSAPRSYAELLKDHKQQIRGYLKFMGVPEREMDDVVATALLRMHQRHFFKMLFRFRVSPTRAEFNRFLFIFLKQANSYYFRKAPGYNAKWVSEVSTQENMAAFLGSSEPRLEESLHYQKLYQNFRRFLQNQEAYKRIRIKRPNVVTQLLDFMLLGYSPVEIARKFKISPSFITYWKAVLEKQAEEFQENPLKFLEP